jgi:hypothetical protein
MMDPAWPKRIAYGHADGQPENDEKMGFSERRIAQRFLADDEKTETANARICLAGKAGRSRFQVKESRSGAAQRELHKQNA